MDENELNDITRKCLETNGLISIYGKSLSGKSSYALSLAKQELEDKNMVLYISDKFFDTLKLSQNHINFVALTNLDNSIINKLFDDKNIDYFMEYMSYYDVIIIDKPLLKLSDFHLAFLSQKSKRFYITQHETGIGVLTDRITRLSSLSIKITQDLELSWLTKIKCLFLRRKFNYKINLFKNRFGSRASNLINLNHETLTITQTENI